MSDEYIWTDDLSVGVEVLDRDHQWLFMVINEMDAIPKEELPQQQRRIRRMLFDFLSYTHYHFQREEMLMKACGYPELEQHKRLHESLKGRLVAFVDAVRKGFDDEDFIEFKTFQRYWWVEHIRNTDRKYQSWMEKNSDVVQSICRDLT